MFGRWIKQQHRITAKATSKKNSNHIGELAEQSACKWLQQQGLILIQKNYRCRTGEIDLIMHDNEHLLFIEVRFRSGNNFGGAAASVDHHKQRKLIHAAHHFLSQPSQFNHLPCRFDVLAAKAPDNNAKILSKPQLPELHWSWVKDAFTT
jgi:putative endonuclease